MKSLIFRFVLAALVAIAPGLSMAQNYAPPFTPRNMLIGADASTNPFQRGSSPVTGIAATGTFMADRWFGYGGAGSSVTLSQQGTSGALLGTTKSFQVARAAANADVTRICTAQIIESTAVQAARGQTVALRGYLNGLTALTSAGAQLEVLVTTGTGSADFGRASLIANSWTSQTNVVDQFITVPIVLGSWTRFDTTFQVGATVSNMALQICFTPVGVAPANDGFRHNQFQMEVGTTSTPFENLPSQMVLALAQRYFYQTAETGSGGMWALGQVLTTTTAQVYVYPPVQMRSIPAWTFTQGSSVLTQASGASQAVTGVGADHSGRTYCGGGVTVGAATLVAGNATMLQGGGGVGIFTCDSEL